MTPSVLLVISTPMKRFFSHLPACVEASACGICRASASIRVIACSAVVIELPNGVFITMTPRAVAAGMSTLSTPMPARPITFRLFASPRILDVTLVAERIASPSKPLIAAASRSLSLPSLGWKSTWTPRSLKICTAAGESASEMRTLGAMGRCSCRLANSRIASAQPAEHVRISLMAAVARRTRLDRHAVAYEHRHAEIVAGYEVLQDPAGLALIAVRMERDRGIDPELERRRVGPGNRRHFVGRCRRERRLLTLLRRRHRDMAGFVQEVARIGEALLVDQDRAVADVEAGKDRRL